jgi:CheY-like chemotaxis protein
MNKRVLCVDDVYSNLDLVRRVLEHMKRYDVVAVTSGKAALAEVSRQPPDLMVIDLRMPDIDGYALVAQLRDLPELQNCQYIALSAEVSDTTEMRCLAAGFGHYISKPFDIAAFQTLVASLLD